MNSTNIYFPLNFTALQIQEALYTLSCVFVWKKTAQPNVILRIDKVHKMDLLGVVVAYKFFEFSVTHKCFNRPSVEGAENRIFGEAIRKYGFQRLLDGFLEDNLKKKLYKDIKITSNADIIIAPHILDRANSKSQETLNTKYYPAIQNYYGNTSKKTAMICSCIPEIILNFWRHATGDNFSVAVACGNQNSIEFVCADNGVGILTSLRTVPAYSSLSDTTLIRKCVQQRVTSKPNTSHTGDGLWLIDTLCKMSNSTFFVISEGVSYMRRNNKTKVDETGFWQGTIIYLNLRLTNAKTLSDIDSIPEI